jgi:Esterase-like activity of phytase
MSGPAYPRTGPWRPLLLLCLVTAVGVTACGPALAPAGAPAVQAPPGPAADEDASSLTLDLLGEFLLPPGQMVDGTLFGSVSSVAADPRTGQWVGAVDDRKASRLVWLDVASTPTFRVTPRGFTFLRADAPAMAPEVATQADLEGLVVLPDGSFAAVDEGHQLGSTVWQPQILRIQRDGRVTSGSRPPAWYDIPAVRGTTGVRPNLCLEILTRRPGGHLMSGLEQPLLQDDVSSRFGHGGHGRLVEFAPEGDGFRPVHEYAYHLAPTPRLNGYDGICQDGANGLSDLLALSDSVFLALERSCLVNLQTRAVHNTTQIFEVTIEGAEDVFGRVSLRQGSTPRPVRKRRVLDLRKMVGQLSSGLSELENFEGLGFGPVPPGGSGRTVLVLSDDNFRARQKTAILWFSLIGSTY